MEFKDKVVFVTAAAGAGIGQAVARTFATEGATVVLSDQHAQRSEQVAAQIAEDTGQEVTGFGRGSIDRVVGVPHRRLDVVVGRQVGEQRFGGLVGRITHFDNDLLTITEAAS